MAERSRPFLVPLFPEQMELLLELVRPCVRDSFLASRTEHALLAGLALAQRYSAPEEPAL